jgi:hypothetical protein
MNIQPDLILNVLAFVFTVGSFNPAIAQTTRSTEIAQGISTETSSIPLLLRIPAHLIAKSVNRDFEQVSPVNQIVLGTTSKGISHCSGNVTCVIRDNPTGVSILCCIVGDVHSETCGTNCPAVINSTAVTNYTASKELTFDGTMFACNPATVTSRTEITITGIRSSLPGLRGRLVKRIATKRARETHTQAEAIVGRQTESELCKKIDADFEHRLADMNRQFEKKLSILRRFPAVDKQLRLRSAIDGIEVGVAHPSANPSDEGEMRKPIGESVEIWLRRSENLVSEGPTAAMLFTKAPSWLPSYFLEEPIFLKPDQRKWGVELQESWIVIRLHE